MRFHAAPATAIEKLPSRLRVTGIPRKASHEALQGAPTVDGLTGELQRNRGADLRADAASELPAKRGSPPIR